MPRMNEPLDVFGQNPRLSRLYTQLCFCFPVDTAKEDAQSTAYHTISKGLADLARQVPWITGQVTQNEKGLYIVEQFKDSAQINVKDFRDELPHFDRYRDAFFPFALLDESTIAPCETFPEALDQPAPALYLQLNYIRGGVLLVVNAQHNCMDLRGQAQIIRLFAKACCGEELSDDEIASANTSTQDHPLLGLREKATITASPVAPTQPRRSDAENNRAVWAYFNFTSDALQTLKEIASKDCTTPYISTDDALCAFVWQAVTRARIGRIESGQSVSTFERQVDARKHVGMPFSYIGNLVCKVSVQMPCNDLLTMSLGSAASRLREAISPEADIGLQTRNSISHLRESLANSRQKPAPRTTVPSLDIKMSSWAKEDCCNFDFGTLGKAEVVRRPAFDAWEGLAYAMPKTRDGQIAIALCLRDDDLEALQRDQLVARYGTYVG